MEFEKLKNDKNVDEIRKNATEAKFLNKLLESYDDYELIYDEALDKTFTAYGKPIERSEMVVCYQGINKRRFLGTCGIVSCVNVVNISEENRLFEKRVLENDLVSYAVEKGLCDANHRSNYDNGATTASGISEILSGLGIENTVLGDEKLPDLNQLGEIIKSGDVAILGVNAADFYDNTTTRLPFYRNRRHANHAVTVTGVAYENNGNQNEELKGFYFADSGRGRTTDKARFVDLNQLNKSFVDKVDAVCIVAHIDKSEKLN